MTDKASGKTSVLIGGSLGGAIATVLTWIASEFFAIDLPPQVAAAMALILIAIGGWLGSKKK
ncbi:MAG: hypothetical protein QOJ84_722 [Bradyrhizobium sp.]|jgi:hypothetical protein|nr:hypothetical protein [Bradyrhizobium sp.]